MLDRRAFMIAFCGVPFAGGLAVGFGESQIVKGAIIAEVSIDAFGRIQWRGEDGRLCKVWLSGFVPVGLLGDSSAGLVHGWQKQVDASLAGRHLRLRDYRYDAYGDMHAHFDMLSPDNVYDSADADEDLWRYFSRQGLGIFLPPPWQAHPPNYLAAEDRARRQKIGLWQNGHLFYRPASDNESVLHSIARRRHFAIVHGQIYDATIVKKWLYLNFAADWRKDFTIAFNKPLIAAFIERFGELPELIGKTIQGRGFLYERDGVRLDITALNQIDRITA